MCLDRMNGVAESPWEVGRMGRGGSIKVKERKGWKDSGQPMTNQGDGKLTQTIRVLPSCHNPVFRHIKSILAFWLTDLRE